MKNKRIYLNAYGPANLFDLSGYLSDFISESELVSGLVFVFSIGSTGALIRTEQKQIFSDWIMSFIPFRNEHRHPGNAFAHLRSTILGSDSTLAIKNKKIKSALSLHLLENTAGCKNRPLELRAIGQFAGGGRLNMKVASNTLPIEANGWIDIVELSQVADDVVLNSGISDGFLHLESLAKQSAVSTTEYEKALLNDTADFISQMVADVAGQNAGLLAKGPNDSTIGQRLGNGSHVAFFKLMVKDISIDNASIAYMEVFDATAKKVLG